jgi:hypothetical protein
MKWTTFKHSVTEYTQSKKYNTYALSEALRVVINVELDLGNTGSGRKPW